MVKKTKTKKMDNKETIVLEEQKNEIVEPITPTIQDDRINQLMEKIAELQKAVLEMKEDISNIIADIDDIEDAIDNKDKGIKPEIIEVNAEDIGHELTKEQKEKIHAAKDVIKDLNLVAAGAVGGFLMGYIFKKTRQK